MNFIEYWLKLMKIRRFRKIFARFCKRRSNEMLKKAYHIINFVIVMLLIIALTGLSLQTGRLYRVRARLNEVEIEYRVAQNRERELQEVVRRTDTILNESSDTVDELIIRFGQIKESYFELAKIISNRGSDCSGRGNYNIYSDTLKEKNND